MKNIEIELEHELGGDERRLISFISDQIESYEVQGKKLILKVNNDVDENEINKETKKLLKKKHDDANKTIVGSNYISRSYTANEDIYKSKIVNRESEGCISISHIGLKLFEFFDFYFSSILKDENANYMQFPTLLNIDTIDRTNYMSTSPQYVLFCSKVKESISEYEDLHNKYEKQTLEESLNYPHYTLSPSACFHLYQSIHGETLAENSIYTMRQNVFRNEGRLNWSELERLQDYHVREIVMIGDHEFVLQERAKLLNRSIKLLNSLNLNYTIQVASDPFIMPVMQKYKKIQCINKIKYELRLNTSENTSIACASYNIHGKAFSSKFNFNVDNRLDTESGCIGFGIERIIIAFLKQYGVVVENWPQVVKEYVEEGRINNVKFEF